MPQKNKIFLIIFIIVILIFISFFSYFISQLVKKTEADHGVTLKEIYTRIHLNLENQANSWKNNSYLSWISGGPISRDGKSSANWRFDYNARNHTFVPTYDMIGFDVNNAGEIIHKEFIYNSTLFHLPIVNWTLDSDEIINLVYNDPILSDFLKSKNAGNKASLQLENLKGNPGIPVCTLTFSYYHDDYWSPIYIKVNAHTGEIIR